MIMADTQAGFTCEFVTKPPDAIQSECPVCLLVLREPYQVTCCGYSFCRDCIEQVNVGRSPCPCCNTTQFQHFPNKGLQRSLYEFKVYCTNQCQGCQWAGELGQLASHLKSDLQEGGCQYVQVPCSYCSKPFQRLNIEIHQNDDCGMRPYHCEYCYTFQSNYDDVTINHWPMCSYVPVPCTNDCGEFLCRHNLKSHIANNCPMTIIDCDFKHIGCKERLPRNDLPAHLAESIDTHLSLQASEQQNLVVNFDDEIQLPGKQVSTHQIKKLTQGMKQLYQNTASLALLTKASHFDRKATSMEREQEELRRMDQRINDLVAENKKLVRDFKKKKQNDTALSYFIVVVLAIVVALLLFRCEDLEEKNEIVKQQLDKLVQDPWAIHMLSYPVDITMTNFTKYKNDSNYWNSIPFYTHLKGYKMFLKVYANGNGVANNTHVSVFITVMQGEFDHHLKWPFRGEFVISILNQEEDNGHETKRVPFDDTVPDYIANRTMERELVKRRGWGLLKFILHTDLRPKYLKNDCIKLRIQMKRCQ